MSTGVCSVCRAAGKAHCECDGPVATSTARDIMAQWNRGLRTTKETERALVALGYLPTEALDLMTKALLS